MGESGRAEGGAGRAPAAAGGCDGVPGPGREIHVVQYYVSWGAAELMLEESQAHYTAELKLLPSDIFYDVRPLQNLFFLML